MRNYPYFIFDAIVLMTLLIAIPLASAYFGFFELAAVSMILFALSFKSSMGRIKDFERSVKRIEGVRSWESDFMSLGTLVFDFKGERLRYQSAVRGKVEGNISVDYIIDAENNSRKAFRIMNVGKGWLGEFELSGDKRFLSSVKKEVSSFNRRYRIEELANAGGILHMVVNLRFLPGEPPSKKEKLEDMAGFLGDYLGFMQRMNKRLKRKS